MIDIQIPETIGYLFIQIYRAHRYKMQSMMVKHDLHPGQELLLFHLGQQDGQTQSELALRLQIQPPTLTRMLDRMVTVGYVKRQSDPADQRISRVYLTPVGRALQKPILDIWREMEKSMLKKLSPDDRNTLQNLLQRIYLNLL